MDGSTVDGSTEVGSTCARLAPGWADAVSSACPWVPVDGPVLVVVPHPDDESLMFGGTLAHYGARGTPVHVLAVTDGGAAYPEVVDAGTLSGLRRSEHTDALAELGLAAAPVTRLDIPDGCVADHDGALVEAITVIVTTERIGAVLAPWQHDHHTDHEACGRAVRRARHDTGAAFAIVSGLFWSMLRDPAPPEVALAAVTLTSDQVARKSAAIRCHRSQIERTEVLDGAEPVLGERELALTRWRREHVILERPG